MVPLLRTVAALIAITLFGVLLVLPWIALYATPWFVENGLAGLAVGVLAAGLVDAALLRFANRAV